jgi:hypothetical protein
MSTAVDFQWELQVGCRVSYNVLMDNTARLLHVSRLWDQWEPMQGCCVSHAEGSKLVTAQPLVHNTVQLLKQLRLAQAKPRQVGQSDISEPDKYVSGQQWQFPACSNLISGLRLCQKVVQVLPGPLK